MSDFAGDVAVAPWRYLVPHGSYRSAAERAYSMRGPDELSTPVLGPYALRIQAEARGMTPREQNRQPVTLGRVLAYDHGRALAVMCEHKPWYAEIWRMHIERGLDWAMIAEVSGRSEASMREALSVCREMLTDIGMSWPDGYRYKRRA